MGYERLFAVKYLSQKKSTGFISLITYFSIIGITIGIAAIMITLAVLDGFEVQVKNKITDFHAHVVVETFHRDGFVDYEYIRKQILETGETLSINAFIQREALIKSGNFVEGISIKGVFEDEVTGSVYAARQVVEGSFNLDPEITENEYGKVVYYPLILGKNLAERLQIHPGSKLFILSTEGITGDASAQPLVKRFILRGIFDSGYYEIDESFGFTSIAAAQNLFKMNDKITGFEVRLSDPKTADDFASKFNKKVGYPFNATSWNYQNTILFAWMESQKLPILIVFSLIAIVAVINLFSTLVMIVVEKKKDIGILKSMGAKKSGILKVFFYEGIYIGLLGILFGGILSFSLCYLQDKFHFIRINKEVYFIESLPVSFSWEQFVLIAGLTIVFCILGSLIPAYMAGRLLPVEAIRYD